jgi:hypothetical protein
MAGSFVPSSFAAALPAQKATTDPTAQDAAAIRPFVTIRMHVPFPFLLSASKGMQKLRFQTFELL